MDDRRDLDLLNAGWECSRETGLYRKPGSTDWMSIDTARRMVEPEAPPDARIQWGQIRATPLAEVFQICAAAIAACPDVNATIARMAPNDNTIALGLVALSLYTGRTPEEIVARFRGDSS